MHEISDNQLKRAVDFVNSGRLLGVPDNDLLKCIQAASNLSGQQFDALVSWFHVRYGH